MTPRFFALQFLLLLVAVACGCSEESPGISPAAHARRISEDDSTTLTVTPEQLRARLKTNEMATFLVSGNDVVEANLFRSGIRSVEALKGVPLRSVDLGFTQVTDLSPLKEMKLQMLILESTPVSDVSIIRGMPLKILKLQNTKVTDFSPIVGLPLEQLNLLNLPFSDLTLLRDMPLEILWLAGTQVTDLAGLPTARLVSLDLERTAVSGIDSLATVSSLRRLNIAQTQVSDVTPLKDLRLERLVLTPERIRTGMEFLRTMKSLTLIQTSIEEEMSANEFWKRYDLGVWKTAEGQ